ncbi:MAG: signal peptidase II [Clostridia bacterium]|nr:signal peptidase II [Clostridia bacterium]
MEKLKPHVKYKSWILVGVFAVLIFLDLLFKYLEEKFAWQCAIIPGWVEIRYGFRNAGCAFSFLNDNPQIGQPLLITVTFILFAALAFLFIVMKEKYIITKTAIAIIAAGAIGNLVDRLWLFEVRDWFGLNMFGSGLVYCNFADFFIVIGAILVVIDILFLEEWSVWPLPKKAREGAKRREEEEKAKKAEKEALANGSPVPQDGKNVNISADNAGMHADTGTASGTGSVTDAEPGPDTDSAADARAADAADAPAEDAGATDEK